MNFSLKFSLKNFIEIFTRQNIMKFSISRWDALSCHMLWAYDFVAKEQFVSSWITCAWPIEFVLIKAQLCMSFVCSELFPGPGYVNVNLEPLRARNNNNNNNNFRVSRWLAYFSSSLGSALGDTSSRLKGHLRMRLATGLHQRPGLHACSSLG